MAKIKKAEEAEVVEGVHVQDMDLAKYLDDHQAEEIDLGGGPVRDIHTGQVIGHTHIGYLYRLLCLYCGDPRCSRIIIKEDEGGKTYVYRSCKKIECREFKNVDVLDKLLEV